MVAADRLWGPADARAARARFDQRATRLAAANAAATREAEARRRKAAVAAAIERARARREAQKAVQ
jgi:hypothetical protein